MTQVFMTLLMLLDSVFNHKTKRCCFSVLIVHLSCYWSWLTCLIDVGLSTKSSSTKDNILEGGGLSSNVKFNDSSTLWVYLLKTLWVQMSKRCTIIRLWVKFYVHILDVYKSFSPNHPNEIQMIYFSLCVLYETFNKRMIELTTQLKM